MSAISRPRIVRLTLRALALRCPHCGASGIFSSWFRLRDRCPGCDLGFERGESGYVVGAYMFNMIAAELGFAAIFLGVLVASWPSPPWELLTWGGAALMVIMPVLFYPFSKTLFLAFDLVFRPDPAQEGDTPPVTGSSGGGRG